MKEIITNNLQKNFSSLTEEQLNLLVDFSIYPSEINLEYPDVKEILEQGSDYQLIDFEPEKLKDIKGVILFFTIPKDYPLDNIYDIGDDITGDILFAVERKDVPEVKIRCLTIN